MIHVYMDYPVPHMYVHTNPDCSAIYQGNKRDYRISKITVKSLSKELSKFANKEYTFAADGKRDDIWLELDLDNEEFEIAVAEYVLKLIGRYYKPLGRLKATVHC